MIGMVSVFKNIPSRLCDDECKTDFSHLEEHAECEEENKFCGLLGNRDEMMSGDWCMWDYMNNMSLLVR